jgi:L-asparaginase
LGWDTEGEVRVVWRPTTRRRLKIVRDGMSAPVALLTVALEDDGRLARAVGDLGYAGVVVEAMGGGRVPTTMVGPLASLARRMPVVLASRAGNGEVLRHTYGSQGAEIDLLNRGLISAGPLDGLKARLLLSLLLRGGATNEEIARVFDGWLTD